MDKNALRLFLILLSLFLKLTVANAANEGTSNSSEDVCPSEMSQTNFKKSCLARLRKELEASSPLCEFSVDGKSIKTYTKTQKNFCDASKGGGNGVGDSVLFNSVLCFTGNYDFACDAVIASQDKTTGRFYRAPSRKPNASVGYKGDGPEYDSSATFSMSQYIGFLLTVVSLHQQNRDNDAKKMSALYMKWISNNEYKDRKGFYVCENKALDMCYFDFYRELTRNVFEYAGIDTSIIPPTTYLANISLGTLESFLWTGCLIRQTFHCHLSSLVHLIENEIERKSYNPYLLGVRNFGYWLNSDNPFLMWVNYYSGQKQKLEVKTNSQMQNDLNDVAIKTYNLCTNGKNAEDRRHYLFEQNRKKLKNNSYGHTGWECVALLKLIEDTYPSN